MKSITRSALSLLFLPGLAVSVAGYSQTTIQPAPSPKLQANYGKLPLSFELNQGQSDAKVKFQSRGQGYSFLLTDSGATLALTSSAAKNAKPTADRLAHNARNSAPEPTKTDLVQMDFAGASPNPHITGEDPLPGKANYLIGNVPSKWQKNVPTYSRVKYEGVYPGIDLVYYGNQQKLEYDFNVAPGADPKPIQLHFAGANTLKLDPSGDLRIIAANGQVAFHKPVVYQTIAGKRIPVTGKYTMAANNIVGFEIGTYDHSQRLVIDPVLAYSTYFQGSVLGMTTDISGNVYITGIDLTDNVPATTGAAQTRYTGAFITKLNAAGTALIYSTYLGGTNGDYPDYGRYIAVSPTGEAYVSGYAGSTNFPVTSGAYQSTPAECFLSKLNAQGSDFEYSTYFGTKLSSCWAMALDSVGDIFLAGDVRGGGGGFPITPGAFQQVPGIESTAFVAKLNPTGSALLYSTYLGGVGKPETEASGIAVDSEGAAYVTGGTEDPDFPVTAIAFQRKKRPLSVDSYAAYVTKFNPSGSALEYSTFLSGTAPKGLGTYGSAITVDRYGHAYVTGTTYSAAFPTTPGVVQPTDPNPVDYSNDLPFVTKLRQDGSYPLYSTYLGGDSFNSVAEITLDSDGRAYIIGDTFSKTFPTTPDAFQSANLGGYNVFFSILNPDATSFHYSTYLGGTEGAFASAISLDRLGNVYLAGKPDGSDFPVTPGAYAPGGPYAYDNYYGFVSKFAFNGITTTTLSSSKSPQSYGGNITFTAHVAPAVEGDVPMGTVTFRANNQSLAKVTLDGNGDAQYTTSNLPVGSAPVIAYYLGEIKKYSASSTALTQVVTGPAAAPTFVSPGGTHSGSFHAAIEDPTPGSSIYYTLNGKTPTTSSTLYTAPILINSTTTVKAIAAIAGGTASPVTTVNYTIASSATASATSLKSSANPSTVNHPVTFTATVTVKSGPTPTGSVSFLHGDVVMGTVSLVNGVAKLTVSNLTAEQHSITATYTGSSSDAASQSPALLQVVNP